MKSYEQAALDVLLGKTVEEAVKPEVEKSFPASGVTKHAAPKGVSTMPKDKKDRGPMPAGSMKKEEVGVEEAALDVLLGKTTDLEEMGPGRGDPKKKDREESEKQMADFLAKGGEIQQSASRKTKRPSLRMVASGSLSSAERKRNPFGGKSFVRKEETDIEEAAVHPMGLHVKRVPGQMKNGQEVYKVHAVGSKVSGIKTGEHLNDTELDDATEAGHKIKMMKEDIDYTVISHKSFEVFLPESLTYVDYLNAAKMLDENEAVKIADEFFSEQDISLVVGSIAVTNIQEEINSFVQEGHEVSLPKYTGETDNPGVEFTVIDKDSGVVTKFIHHGTVKRS